MEKLLKVTYLYDFYGQLLTEKQDNIIQKYYLEDLSLSEIASQEQVSRQSIHDTIKRVEKKLVAYEDKLGLVKRFKQQEHELESLVDEMQKIKAKINDPQINNNISALINKMQKLIND